MPRVFEIDYNYEEFEAYDVVHEDDQRVLLDGFDLSPMRAQWRQISYEVSSLSRANRSLVRPDFASAFGYVPLISSRAVDVLVDKLGRNVEYLPATVEGERRWIINIVETADVMDVERSVAKRFKSGKLMLLETLVLRRDLCPLSLPPMFKLPQFPKGPPLVTDDFIEVVESAALTGLQCKLVSPP